MKKLENTVSPNLGSKANNLLVMAEKGLPVPPFSLYTYDFLLDSSVRKKLSDYQKTYQDGKWSLEILSEQLKTLVVSCFPKERTADILELQAHNQLFSVRSSASVEDGSGASFAGQFSSQLYVSSSELISALETVLLSLFDLSTLAYFFKQGFNLEQIHMTAIVQEMIIGQESGIYFTANPQGILNEHIIVLGKGDGSGIVEDRVATSMTTYHPQDDLSYIEQTEGSPLLDMGRLKLLREKVELITDLFGPYLDIEFTFADGELYILQARPITTLPSDQIRVLDNSNIVESYPGLSTPLTISFVKEAYTSIFRSLASRLLNGKKEALVAYEGIFQNMVAAVNHRFYYQIDAWYQLLQLLPFSKRIIPIWQEMLGVRNPQVPEMPLHLSTWQHCKINYRLLKNFITAPRQMEALASEFNLVQDLFNTHFSSDASPQDLINLFMTLKSKVLDNWDITLINDLYAFIFTGLLKKMSSDKAIQANIAGVEHIESMKPALALQACLEMIRDNPSYLRTLEKEPDFEAYLKTDAPLAKKLKDFIALYGDRSPEELKLETETYRTHPERLRTYLLESAKQEVSLGQPQCVKPEEKLSILARWLRNHAKTGIKYREASRLNRTRLYGMVRAIFRALGQHLVDRGDLQTRDDVFFLNMEEVFAAFDIQSHFSLELDQLVKERRQSYERDKNLPTFSRLIYAGEIFDKTPAFVSSVQIENNDDKAYKGIGCSKGRVIGEVLVVSDVKEVTSAREKIIVTKMTDPGWVHLLTQAKGIIAEQGSLLSHTAIISRELGIPSVVAVRFATTIFKTGEWVEMDGLTGYVKKVESTDE